MLLCGFLAKITVKVIIINTDIKKRLLVDLY